VTKKLNRNDFTSLIREEAHNLGFLECGFAQIRTLDEHKQPLLQWLNQGHHAGMTYMEKYTEQRINPVLLVEGAKSVISLLYNYYTPETLEGSPLRFAKYAFGTDYHLVIKNKLKQLSLFIQQLEPDVVMRTFVDTGPVLEKAWAQNSGLGWIGKNSCLISRRHGSFVFIAEIITSLEFDYGKSSKDFCGTCRRCIDTCPTQAITESRTINSERCISYQTIENRGEIAQTLKDKFHHFIYGCDICQDVCPWNQMSKPHAEPLFYLRDELRNMTLDGWKNLDEPTYQRVFQKSAVKRAKFGGLKRNIEFVVQK